MKFLIKNTSLLVMWLVLIFLSTIMFVIPWFTGKLELETAWPFLINHLLLTFGAIAISVIDYIDHRKVKRLQRNEKL